MRKIKYSLLSLLLASFLLPLGCSSSSGEKDFDLVIFHTNDRHSHMLGLPNCEYDPATPGDGTIGGAARWVQLVEDERATGKDVLLLDAGDFTMGTLLVSGNNAAADLDFMKEVGYAAAALGNHEFDWGPAALAEMIQAANQPPIPLLAANTFFNADDPADDSLAALYGNQGEAGKFIHPYITLETPSGTKVGLFGLMGLEAYSVSNARPVVCSRDIDEMAATSQAVVDKLRNEEKVDVVICLAHVGIVFDGDTPGDETIELAKKTEGIDIILSGHHHTDMTTGVAVQSEVGDQSWSTYTMETRGYARAIGRYELKRQGGTRSASGAPIDVDDSLSASQDVTTFVDGLIQDVEDNVLAQYPLVPAAGAFLTGDMFQILTHSGFDMPRHKYTNNNLGAFAADAMREASGAQMAFASNGGDLRASLERTNGDQICLSDAFISVPLGTGPDGQLGYPLVKFYLSLMEIKLLMEATTADWGLGESNDYQIHMSGLRAVFDSSIAAGSYNRVIKLTQYTNIDESDDGTVLFDVNNGGFQMDTAELFEVCTSSYIADQMGSFNVYPKNASGQNVTIEESIVKDADQREVKLWYVFAQKLSSEDPISDQYNEAYPPNPVGPYWRRAWDLNTHPCEGHRYCQ